MWRVEFCLQSGVTPMALGISPVRLDWLWLFDIGSPAFAFILETGTVK